MWCGHMCVWPQNLSTPVFSTVHLGLNESEVGDQDIGLIIAGVSE